jgi:acyl-CoA synthetase (AMP-forming)/AMP-acid ligase II/peptidoglycan/LPS O-acetylase OafA/YrhL
VAGDAAPAAATALSGARSTLLRPLAPPGFAAGLRRFGQAPALLTADTCLTYEQLDDRVQDVVDQLGPQRRLLLVEAAHTIEAVVAYLAGLRAGSPVLLATGPTVAALTAAYDPDVVLLAADGWSLRERRAGSAHALHEDLALLMSTSGSTGSPKLVRLSRDNLASNATAIAGYLGLRPGDVAATTLPMGYCYGLSVLNSHLDTGAAVLLTELSVVDPCFWELFRQHAGTSLVGVPHTFDLLDRVGFAERDLPSLRRVTQAGGRLPPERVRRYAELGQRRGWDLYVMYGQTEATARMAYLPPDLALSYPASIGRPVQGGAFTLEPVEGLDDEELVYSGPNVMLGYATSPADLALGRTVDRLRTGDLARRNEAGLYEIVGRRSRISKVFGLRVDLTRVEEQLGAGGVDIWCAGGDDELVVAARCGQGEVRTLAERVAAVAGLPARAVRVVPVDDVPRLANGKPDLQAVAALAAPQAVPATPTPTAGDVAGLCALVAEVLDRPVTPDDTFVGLGGDSLSYVETSLRLEEALGTLPAGWHVTPLRDLAPARRTARRRGRVLETGVLLRAVAILLIVGSHADLWILVGGAHVLLGVAGFNFARFHLTGSREAGPSRRTLRSVRRIVVPSVLWIAFAAALTERYTVTNVLLLNGVLGPDRWGPTWHYWFLEVLVYILLGCAALLAIPAVRRAERRWPWGFAVAVLAAGVLSRFQPGWLPTGPDRIHTAHVVFWLFALGWAAAHAGTVPRRLLLSGVLLATVPGFFGDPAREAVVVLGLLALLWVSAVRVPAVVAAAASALAAASLHIYVTHWLVYPDLERWSPLAATLASVAVGLAYRQLDLRVQERWSRWFERRHGSLSSG